MSPTVSLKARALRLLAQREHSRSELRRKLMLHAKKSIALARQAAISASESGEPIAASRRVDDPEDEVAIVTQGAQIEAVLDWLEAHRYLSEQRFVESRVNARAPRFGNLRIRGELAKHGVELDAVTAQTLRDGELARAREVWIRRFGGEPAADARIQARQMRFLAGRGFSTDVIQKVVRPRADD